MIIDLRDISFSYRGGRPVLDRCSFRLHRGERVGIVGSTGSGKTTLFSLIMGLLQPGGGTIELFGKRVEKEKDFAEARRRIGLLFQDADDQLFSPTVLEDVAFGPLNLGKSPEEAAAKARETLASLGLSAFEDRVTYRLSGGEKTLVSLAGVLAMEPEILLLDEPTNGLDEAAEEKLVSALLALEHSRVTISHNLDFLAKVADKVYILKEGALSPGEALVPHAHVHIHRSGDIPHEHDH